MLIKTKNRWDALKALHNSLLKDTARYCNNCGDYESPIGCCANPDIGSHLKFVALIKKQNEELRKTRYNQFASTGDKSMRFGISIPPRFLADLEVGFRNLYNEPIFREKTKKEDLRKFMKTFPHFTVCDKI